MSINKKLTIAEYLTYRWAKGNKVNWPDEGEWKTGGKGGKIKLIKYPKL